MSDEEEFEAGLRVAAMWRALGEQIAAVVPNVVINADDPAEAIRWATCAEACFWKASGDADTHDVKDVLATPPVPSPDAK